MKVLVWCLSTFRYLYTIWSSGQYIYASAEVARVTFYFGLVAEEKSKNLQSRRRRRNQLQVEKMNEPPKYAYPYPAQGKALTMHH